MNWRYRCICEAKDWPTEWNNCHMLFCQMLIVCVCLQLTTGHRVALSTIGYVGCSISIVCLAITLVTFAVLSWVFHTLYHSLDFPIKSLIHFLPTVINFVLYVCIHNTKFIMSCFCLLNVLFCRSVSTIRNQRYHIHANLSFAILVAEILLLISARFDPGTVGSQHY